VVDYDDRYAALLRNDVVISATTSPHYTVTLERVAEIWDKRPRLFIDLAVPRDMDPGLGDLSGLSLADIDCLTGEGSVGIDEGEQKKIEAIIREGIEEFTAWYSFRNHIDSIDAIRKAASTEIAIRMEGAIRSLGLDAGADDKLRLALAHASQMAAGKLLFGLRETLESSLWEPCFAALREAAGLKPGNALDRGYGRG
jgi:glutamyl-tRNA reductase